MLKQFALLAAAGALLAFSPAAAQDIAADFPNRPIRVIVANPAGGGIDTVTRIVTDALTRKLGHPVIIENRGGAGGNIGAGAGYTSTPAGYTLLATLPAPVSTKNFMCNKLNFQSAQIESVAVPGAVPNTLLGQ